MASSDVLSLAYAAVRAVVILALVYASLIALAHWAIRNRRINRFGAWPRAMRRLGDPVLLPLERRIVRAGGSPQNAPLWLVAIVIGAGLVLLSFTGWLIGMVTTLQYAAQGGPRVWVAMLVNAVITLLMTAILVRVIASWFGIGEYRRWMRPIYALTNWLIDPIRRLLPPFGMFDLSPMVAWLVLYLVRGFVMGLL